MSKMKLTYLGDLRTEITHIQSGDQIFTDAPTDNKGRGEAFSPTDLTASSLAACVVTVMGIKCNEWNKELGKTDVSIEKLMRSNPRRIGKIIVDLTIKQEDLNEREVKILENTGKTCPVAKSLHPDIDLTLNFNWT